VLTSRVYVLCNSGSIRTLSRSEPHYVTCMGNKGPDIFGYYDYAKYLRDHYEHFRVLNTWYSYRYIQSRTGVDPGYLVKVFQGRKNLSEAAVPRFAQLLKLNKLEAEYFGLMVVFAKAGTNEETRHCFERLLSYSRLETRKLDKESYQYYEKWYYAAIRQILSYYPFRGDYEALGAMTEPAISAAEAKKAVQLLEKLGLIVCMGSGWEVTSRFITTGPEWRSIAIRHYQEETLLLARYALESLPKEERDISTVSVTLSEEGLAKAKEMLTAFRHSLLEMAGKEEKANRAYHLNLQLIPVSKPWKQK